MGVLGHVRDGLPSGACVQILAETSPGLTGGLLRHSLRLSDPHAPAGRY